MKIYVSSPGSPKAGISGSYAEIDLRQELVDSDDRIWARKLLREAFTEIFGEPAFVRIAEECPDCGSYVTAGRCTYCDPEEEGGEE